MKQLMIISIIVVSFPALACDICGGVSMPSTQGILPGTEYHFIGIRSSWISFHTNADQNHSSSREDFYRLELNGRFQVNRRFSLQANMPYVINTQFKEGESTMVDGIGDSQINVYWNVLQKANTDRQRNTLFRIGTGVKAPTGNYSKDVWETSNLFPGTGSFDMNASSYFSINLKDFGLINENMFVLKTKNPVAYRYGNAFLSRTLVTYRKRLGVKTAILPFTGVSVFYTSKDRIKNIPVSQTFNNGTQLVYEIGTSFLTQKMMTTIKYGLPILQNISGGDVKMNGNVEFAINFLINKK